MSYESDSVSERLAAVRAAIARVLNAQAYGTGNNSLQYAQLATLREMERELQREAEIASGGMVSLGTFPRPS